MDKQPFWQQHLDGWRASGQTQRAYCQAHGLSLDSMGYWRSRLKVLSKAKGLLPIIPAPAAAMTAAPLEVVLGNGLVLRIPPAAAPGRIAVWIKVLSAC